MGQIFFMRIVALHQEMRQSNLPVTIASSCRIGKSARPVERHWIRLSAGATSLAVPGSRYDSGG
jgi:hypothetical protein